MTAQTTYRPLTEGEKAFVARVGEHYHNDGFPLDSGRVLGWMIISDPPEQSATEIAARLAVSPSTVDAVAEQLVPATLLNRRDGENGEYFLSLSDEAWPRVVSHTFAGWPGLHQILKDGSSALAGEPAERSARVDNMERLFAYLVTELPDMMRRWEQRES
jgi:DNA-binding MarR family transcriptional regulator